MKRIFPYCLLLVLSACRHGDPAAPEDERLFGAAFTEEGYIWYKNDPALLTANSESPHQPLMRVRFNQIASSALDTSGKLSHGAEFPDGSLIVKEVFAADTTPTLLVIMERNRSSKLARSGYLWAEYKPDGEVVYSAGNMAEGCINCHSSGNHRDLVRLFDLFP